MSADLLGAALAYAGAGLRVLPLHSVDHIGECTCGASSCTSPGKHPSTAHGVREASADPEQVRQWWARWPTANVGLATGPAAGEGLLGWWVLDLDKPKAGEIDGRDALEVLAEIHGGLPRGAVSLTGSGGMHLLFRWPESGPAIRSRARVLRHDGAWVSADTRGLGGYIVAPPSMHATGARYTWGEGAGLEALCAAPAWLEAAVRARDEAKAATAGARALSASGGAEDRSWEVGGDRASRYVAGALAKACERLEKLGAGQRHASLLREGRTIGGWLHLVSQPDEEQATAALAEAAMRAGLGEKDARRTARDGVQHGMNEPRDLPPLPEGMRDSPRGGMAAGDGWEDWGSPDAPETLDPGEPTWDGMHDEDVVPGVGIHDVGEEDPDYAGVQVQGRPTVIINPQSNGDRQAVVLEQTWKVLRGLRGEGAIYLRGGRLARISNGAILDVTPGALISTLVKSARWVKLRPPKAREITAGEAMLEDDAEKIPTQLLDAMLADPDPRLPQIERLVRAPFWHGEGEVVQPGYHAPSRSYLMGQPHKRSPVDGVGDAVDLLLGEWLGDFPFASDADRAHALAALLTPIVRAEIDGPCPLVMIEAPERRTGKTLLMELLTEVSSGQVPNPAGWAHDDEERRKTWSMLVRRGEAVICVDNVSGRMDDDPLCRILTSGALMERLLGTQDAIDVPARSVWMATGNNALMSQDLIGRSIRVRLDSQTDTPEARQEFRIADIKAWTRARVDLLRSAALELVAAWHRQGRPYSGARLGKFEGWSRVVGGILEVAGVRGFLGNRTEQADAADPERAEWRSLLEVWMGPEKRGQAMQAGEIARMAVEAGLLLAVVGDGNDVSRARRMGQALVARRGRVTRVGETGVRVEQVKGAKGSICWKPQADAQIHAFRSTG